MLWGAGTSGGCKRAGGLPNAAGWEPGPREGAGGGADGAVAGSRGWGGSEMPGCSTSGRDKDAELPAGGGTSLMDSASPLKLSIKAAVKEKKKHVSTSQALESPQRNSRYGPIRSLIAGLLNTSACLPPAFLSDLGPRLSARLPDHTHLTGTKQT